MSVTPSRLLLVLTGGFFLTLLAARVVLGPYALGLKLGGGMIFWHFAIGMACLGAGATSRHDYNARRAAFAIALVLLSIGIVVAGTRDSAGYSATDALTFVGASTALLVGALVSDPREETREPALSS